MKDERTSILDSLPEQIALQSVLRASDAARFCGMSISHFRRLHSRGHATKTTTRKVYMRGAAEISARVQEKRQSKRHGKQSAVPNDGQS